MRTFVFAFVLAITLYGSGISCSEDNPKTSPSVVPIVPAPQDHKIFQNEAETKPCYRELRCEQQMERLGAYSSGLYRELMNQTIFKNLCQEKDECLGLNLKTIKVCIQNGLHYLPVSLVYRKDVHKFLCTQEGKSLVSQLPHSRCAYDNNKEEEMFDYLGQCMGMNQDSTGTLSEDPLDCRIFIYHKCAIREYDKHCGSVWSTLLKRIVDTMLISLSHCKDYITKKLN